MEQRQERSTLQTWDPAKKVIDPEKLKVIEWEDYEQEVARLWSLSSALREAKEKKQALEEKLQSLIQVGSRRVVKNLISFLYHITS